MQKKQQGNLFLKLKFPLEQEEHEKILENMKNVLGTSVPLYKKLEKNYENKVLMPQLK